MVAGSQASNLVATSSPQAAGQSPCFSQTIEQGCGDAARSSVWSAAILIVVDSGQRRSMAATRPGSTPFCPRSS